jgi:ABC-type amino acid transport substrate-binding protein
MKNIKFSSGRALILAAGLATAGLSGAFAQESVTTTTTSAGTVSEFTPGLITVTSSTGAPPVSYSYSKTTTYVDENGNPVSSQVIRSGVPVTVYYTQQGNQMLASKVVVRRVEAPPPDGGTIIKKTTTTTSTPAP